jgi:hypothetical protein
LLDYEVDEMSGAVTFLPMPRSKPKTSAEGQEQLSSSLARMASAPTASKGIPITEVVFGQCRFVVDDRTFPALCCAEATLGGSWCAHHRALVFVRVAAPQHNRKPAQEALKAPEVPKAVPVPEAPAPKAPHKTSAPVATASAPLPAKGQGAPLAGSQPRPAEKQKQKPEHPSLAPQAQAPAAFGKGKQDLKTSKEAAQRAPRVAAKLKDRPVPAKAPEPSRKPAAPKAAQAPKKAAAAPRKAGKPPASAKKASATAAAKRAAPAKKAAPMRKSNSTKRAPAKKATPTRKGTAAKRTPSSRTGGGRKAQRR